MFNIKIANIIVRIDNQYSYVYRLCKNYIVEDTLPEDLYVRVTDEEVQTQIEASEIPTSPAYAEGVCVYRQICEKLPSMFASFLFHGAVIEYEGRGYVFAAKSGTGKSTHIALWQRRFGDGVRVINGDKPIMRFEDGVLYAYGTPWCGKEGMEINARVPVCALCFLERGKCNEIVPISAADAVMRVFQQVLTPTDLQSVDTLFPLLDQMLREIPCYLLKCTMDEEAAEVSYEGMRREPKKGEDHED